MAMEDVMKLFMGQLDADEMYTVTTEEFTQAFGDQHIEVINNFASHIVKGTDLLAPGAEGINGVRLANAMHLSDWLGQEVAYDHDSDQYLELLNERIKEEGKFDTKA